MSEEKQNYVTIEFRRGYLVVKAEIPTSPKKIFVAILLVIVFAVTIISSADEELRKALLEILLGVLNAMVIFGVKRIR